MASVKTTVSIQKTLFEKIENLSREMGVSRSSLFGMALEDFVRRYENKQILGQINAAYDDELDPEEQATLRGILHLHRETTEGDRGEW